MFINCCHLSLGLEVPETVQEPPELGIKDEVIEYTWLSPNIDDKIKFLGS